MNRFAINCMKRNVRLFTVGLAGVVQDVAYEDDGGEAQLAKQKIAEEVTKLCEKHVDKSDINGMSVAITFNGKLGYKRGFGYKDAEHRLPADGDMKGDVASITKVLTAHLLMQLHERPDVDFNVFDNLRDYFPHLDKDLTMQMTAKTLSRPPDYHIVRTKYPHTYPLYVVWLLTHRTGIRHYINFVLESELALNNRYQSTTEAMEVYKDDELYGWPGYYKYSSYGFNMAGALIEKLTGRNYREHATDELHRFNMRNTFFPLVHEDVIFDHARGYKDHNYHYAMFVDLAYKYPSGGLVSTVGDLVKLGDIYLAMFQGCLDNEGKSPLKQSTVELMWSNHDRSRDAHNINGRQVGYLFQAIGWRFKNMLIRPHNKDFFVSTFYHAGNASGFTSILGTNFVTKCNLAGKDQIKYKYTTRPRPCLPDGLTLCSFETNRQELVQNGIDGFTIAIITNKDSEDNIGVLYWKIVEVIVRCSKDANHSLLRIPS